METSVNKFLEAMRIKSEAKAREMAKLELSLWDLDHYMGLVNLGMTEKQIKEHKAELMSWI